VLEDGYFLIEAFFSAEANDGLLLLVLLIEVVFLTPRAVVVNFDFGDLTMLVVVGVFFLTMATFLLVTFFLPTLAFFPAVPVVVLFFEVTATTAAALLFLASRFALRARSRLYSTLSLKLPLMPVPVVCLIFDSRNACCTPLRSERCNTAVETAGLYLATMCFLIAFIDEPVRSLSHSIASIMRSANFGDAEEELFVVVVVAAAVVVVVAVVDGLLLFDDPAAEGLMNVLIGDANLALRLVATFARLLPLVGDLVDNVFLVVTFFSTAIFCIFFSVFIFFFFSCILLKY